jgi:hypothetical protein
VALPEKVGAGEEPGGAETAALPVAPPEAAAEPVAGSLGAGAVQAAGGVLEKAIGDGADAERCAPLCDALAHERDWEAQQKQYIFSTPFYTYTGTVTDGSTSVTAMSSVTGLTANPGYFQVTGVGIPQVRGLTHPWIRGAGDGVVGDHLFECYVISEHTTERSRRARACGRRRRCR